MAVTLTLAITQNSQSTSNNTSNVTVSATASWTGGSYNATGQCTGSITIDGTKYSFSGIKFNTGQTTTGSAVVMTKTVNVNHNSDGTKTLSCSASFVTGVSSGTIAASASKALTTIPRKSTLTVGNSTLGTAQTLTVTRQSTSFTHSIYVYCHAPGSTATEKQTICTKSTSGTISFTPPLSWASLNTTGYSLVTLYDLCTYNGDTLIGVTSYSTTTTIPTTIKPVCSLSVTDPTGCYSKYGAYVKSLSKFEVAVTVTQYSYSSIKSYKTTANGSTYTKANFTTDVLKTSGTSTITATVTDGRGTPSNAASESVTVLDYKQPTVVSLIVRRCDADGTINDQGECIQATFSATVTDLNSLNTAVYKIRYKKTSETEYTEISSSDTTSALAAYSGVYTITDGVYIFEADSGSSYNVEFEASDDHNSTTRVTSASTAFTLMHFHSSGYGIGIGKIAEETDLFDIGLPTKFNEPVYGNVAGLNKVPEILEDSDLNDYLSTGCWAVYKNATATTISNIPVEVAGRLEVVSSTGEGIRTSEWSYLKQIYIPYLSATYPVYERDITRNASNLWTYSEWSCAIKEYPPLAAGKNFDNVTIPGQYPLLSTNTASYVNCPIASGTGTLEVFSQGSEGQLKQRVSYCSKDAPAVYERFYYQSTWGEWIRTSDFGNKLLASPNYYMNGSQSVTLSEPISAQPTGIVLVFSQYKNGAVSNASFHCRFIPKSMVTLHSGVAQCIQLSTSNLDIFATKYLYISDSKITGHDNNTLTFTGDSGITATNSAFVLRYVIGV